MKNAHLTRQADIIPSSLHKQPIVIVGAGAIGGWVCLSLAKAGFHDLTVYDHDEVDTVNMNSQFYRFSDIGEKKAVALKKLVADFTHIEIMAIPEKFSPEAKPEGIVISAVDSMSARAMIWDTCVREKRRVDLMIDPRMGAESALLYAMRPGLEYDRDSYSKTLYSDLDAVQERCTAKATIYTANLLAGLTVKTVKDFLVGPELSRTVMWDIAKDDFQAFRKKC